MPVTSVNAVFRAVVLFLVSEVERNIYDQRGLEYQIYESQQHIKVIRRTLQQICTGGYLSPCKALIVLVSCVSLLLFLFNCLLFFDYC